ncbi:aluminum-activated malate transporter 8-like [Dendrobium catenatum]|uniref:aluminum-activated malate transporter 8-like n=1 Tax=Dendrobium catenatum TaxID=906689 RepID=UPI00109FF1AE|nr:aluminum-activated malate transporter 8-like [Dendrobium catenatum]
MEAAARTNQNVGVTSWLPLFQNLKDKAAKLGKKLKKIGKEDPRRILHSFKAGLAISLISIFYYVNPLFTSLGSSSTMWAVLTVVVVMEFTAGGTLSKGLNRTFATLLAGALGLAAQRLAALSSHSAGEPILLSVFVFLLAAMATFSRFVPEIKARYDYGVTIFILTFSMVAVSGYREEELIKLALQRLSTIAIGVATCVAISIFVFPVWAGEDLHNLLPANIDKLACFLLGLEREYFGEKMGSGQILEEASFLISTYKPVLNSKPTEDLLANFARWEPGHGCFGFCHPWKLYLKIGALTRQCAYSMEAISSHISTSKNSKVVITDTEFKERIRIACAEMSSETGKALAELATAIRQMRTPSTAVAQHLSNATTASESLKTLSPAKDASLPEILQSATTAFLLSAVVKSAHHLATAVEELSRVAHFKRQDQAHKDSAVKPVAGGESPPHVVVEIEK